MLGDLSKLLGRTEGVEMARPRNADIHEMPDRQSWPAV